MLIIFLVGFLSVFYYDIRESKKQSSLLNEVDDGVIAEKQSASRSLNVDDSEPVKSDRMLEVEVLQNENPDIVGWLEIENTDISYPVLQGSDNSFYMNHN